MHLGYNKTQLQHAERRKRPTEDVANTSKKFTHQSLGEEGTFIEICFFCGKPAPAGRSFSKASTFGIDINVRQLGLDKYETCVNHRLVTQTVPISDRIKKNNLHLFSWPPVREKSSKQLQQSSLKSKCSLFSRFYIASQTCNGDLD